ncbi:MAG: TIGR01459 family HAD-type hydrolase [Alphaproteobacteria bacterium]|nr:TIGR01459 family HAD-type hydrolase [Alphaproteobacteria bacterium]
MRPPPSIHGLRQIAGRYDGFILDLWGVLHDGERAYPGAVACLEELRRTGKRTMVLSNAPRRVDASVKRMAEIGIPPALIDGVMTSGEDAYRHLLERDDPWYARLGRRCFHVGPERDTGMLEGQDLDVVHDVAAADFILNTGAHMDGDSEELYRPMLEEGARRRIPMVCANPDLMVIHRGRMQICAGLLAESYEKMGGEVRWHGKPHRGVYDICFRRLGIADRSRILAVGDSFRTDIAGAHAAGIDAAFVSHGIHGEELAVPPGGHPDPGKLAALIERTGLCPVAVLPAFVW